MQVRDTQGGIFDSDEIESILDGFDDQALGELSRVRLRDGSNRLVRAAELHLARADDSAKAARLGMWPVPPNAS